MAVIKRIFNADGSVTEIEGELPPAPAKSWDAYDFKKKFTAAERMTIRTAAKSDAGVEDFLDMLDTAAATGTMIKADDDLLNDALDAIEVAGLIAEGRKAEILN